MLLTELGISTDFKPVHALKAHIPMLVTVFGIVIEERLVQQSNAWLPIAVNPVKYCNSLNDFMAVLFLNTSPKSVTATASS